MNVTITDSFKKDFENICRRELEDVGFDTSAIKDEDIPIKYFTISLRTIEKKPRKIFKTEGFNCPLGLEKGLAILEEKIANGESLFYHQSKSINNLTSEDLLLYSWSIHHFHLGETVESDGFIKRTGPVLFAYITDDDFYMIDIKQHGLWSDKGLLQSIYDNWPTLLESWKVNGRLEVNFSSSEIGKLRKAHVNTIVELNDGISFVGPGRGLTTAGTPVEATLKYGDIRRHIDRFICDLKKNPTDFLKTKYSEEEIERMKDVHFDFYLEKKDPNFIIAVDRYSGIYCVLFEQCKFLKNNK